MAKFKNVGSCWVNQKGIISVKINSDSIFSQKDTFVLFPVKDKKTDRHPDYDFCVLGAS